MSIYSHIPRTVELDIYETVNYVLNYVFVKVKCAIYP